MPSPLPTEGERMPETKVQARNLLEESMTSESRQMDAYEEARSRRGRIEPYSEATIRMHCLEIASRGREGHGATGMVKEAKILMDFALSGKVPE